MKNPHPTQAGMIGLAIASATLNALVTKGIFTTAEELAILTAARDSFKGMHTENADFCLDILTKAVMAHAESE